MRAFYLWLAAANLVAGLTVSETPRRPRTEPGFRSDPPADVCPTCREFA